MDQAITNYCHCVPDVGGAGGYGLLEVVVLVDGLGDVPGALHALGEDDKVPRGDLHELLPVTLGVHLHLPLQQVARLLGGVGPRELALLAPPPDRSIHSPAGRRQKGHGRTDTV